MPFLQLTFLAITAMTLLAALRLARVRSGRTALLEGRGRLLFLTAFVFAPPLAVGAMSQPPGTSQIAWAIFVATYVAILTGVVYAMGTVAELIGQFAHGRAAQVIRLALAGTDLDPDDVPQNVPLTPRLGEILAIVRTADAVFPSGPEFRTQSERPGFRAHWESLDRATTTLEEQIAADNQLGLGVASSARAMAEDARSRLTTLRRAAGGLGQEWARS
jgi:hypothetical protein